MSDPLSVLRAQIPWLHTRLREAGLASLTDVDILSTRLGNRVTATEAGLETVWTTYETKDNVAKKMTETVEAAFEKSKASFEKSLELYASKELAYAIKAETLAAATEFTEGKVSEISKVYATKTFVEASKATIVESVVKDTTRSIRALVNQTLYTYASKEYVEGKISQIVLAELGDLIASIEEESEARVAADGRMSAKWSLTATAGDVVTGIELVSAVEGAGRTVSRIRMQADKFELASAADGLTGVAPFTVDLGTGVVTINASMVINGTPLGTIRNNALLPPINFIGDFATAPAAGDYPQNSVYKNTTDGNSYIRTSISTWALFLAKGQTGDAGSAVYAYVTAPSQVFKAPASGVYDPASIVLSAFLAGDTATGYLWEYWNGTSWQTVSGTSTASTYTVTSGSFTGSRTFRCGVLWSGGTEYDEYTLVKLIDGVDGAAAYTVLLTNQTVSVGFSPLNLPYSGELGVFGGALGKAWTDVRAFKGTTELTATLSNPPSAGQFYISAGTAVDGTFWKYDANTVHCTAIESAAASAQLPINVNCENVTTLVSRFSVSKAKAGADGAPGEPGAPGSSAVTVTVSAPEQAFKSTDGTTYTPASITLSSFLTNATPTSYTWQYYIPGSGTWSGAAGSASTLTVVNSAFDGSRTYRCTVTYGASGSMSDSITLVKLRDGATGAAAYAAILSNEAHVVSYDATETAYAGELGPPPNNKAWTSVLAYKGTTALTAVASGPTTGQYSFGIAAFLDGTFAKDGNSVLYAIGMTPTKFTAYADVDINFEGVTTIRKRFSIAKSKAAANGERGSKAFFRNTSLGFWDTIAGNAEAELAITSQGLTKALLDQVTLTGPVAGQPGKTWATTKFWAGNQWTDPGQVINGNMLVNGTIGANQISSAFVLATRVDIGTGPLRTQVGSEGMTVGRMTLRGTGDSLSPQNSLLWTQSLEFPQEGNLHGFKLYGGPSNAGLDLKATDGSSYSLTTAGLFGGFTGFSSLRLYRLGNSWYTPDNFQIAGIATLGTANVNVLQKPAVGDAYSPILHTGAHAISFKWVSNGLRVKIDATEFAVNLSPI